MEREMTQQTKLDMTDVPHEEFGKERVTTTCRSCHYQVRLNINIWILDIGVLTTRPPTVPDHNQRGEQCQHIRLGLCHPLLLLWVLAGQPPGTLAPRLPEILSSLLEMRVNWRKPFQIFLKIIIELFSRALVGVGQPRTPPARS